MNQEKRKKVVVFGANGGIGEEVAFQLAQQMNSNGHEFDVHLIVRKVGDDGKERPNIAQGVAEEILDALPHANKDLARSFAPDHHLMWDDKAPDAIKALEGILTGADIIINPAGVPRKPRPDKTMSGRSELIGFNAEFAAQLGTAIGRFSPPKSLVINCANPADNIGMMIEQSCRKTWEEMGIKDGLPTHKVLTMGGTLDEARFRKFLAREINSRLGPDQPRVLPVHIHARIYGQHGDYMAFDPEIVVGEGNNARPLTQYLASINLQADEGAIVASAKKLTVTAGADFGKMRGRTAQRSPAVRIGEITMAALFSDHPYTLTASVAHEWPGDSRTVASGARVNVSHGGIEIDPQWLNRALNEPALKDAIATSRKAVVADQAAYELIPLLKGATISRANADDNTRVSISIDEPALDKKTVAGLLAEALMVKPEQVKAELAAKPTFSFEADPKLMGVATKLAASLGIIGGNDKIPVAGRSPTD